MRAFFLPPITPGLLAAVALNTVALDAENRRKQLHTLGKSPWGGLSAAQIAAHDSPVPATYEPTADAQSWQYNVGKLLALLQTELRSGNPYNDHTPFAHAAVLAQGWLDVPECAPLTVAPGRSRLDNAALVHRFQVVLDACGFNQGTPVLLDRHGRILDGYHRLLTCQRTGHRAYFLQLDY